MLCTTSASRGGCLLAKAAAPRHQPRRQLRIQVVAAAQSQRQPRRQNVEGAFFVDHTCIDCDTCRWMAPDSFTRVEGYSAVTSQPKDKSQRIKALQALLSCPTHSIHATSLPQGELKEAQQGLPTPIIPGNSTVYHCGWHSPKSFAAGSYLILRPQGNILVDSPRYNPVLAKRIEEMGGLRYIFLTHKDDIADHAAWARHFDAQRIIHIEEVDQRTRDVEIQLTGEGPWKLPGTKEDSRNLSDSAEEGPSRLPGSDGAGGSGDDIQIVFTPGHTRGHLCLLHHPSQALFSGDHLSAPPDEPATDTLYIFEDFNWYSVPTQLASVAKLRDLPYIHVLPGHGRPCSFANEEVKAQAVGSLLAKHGYAMAASRA